MSNSVWPYGACQAPLSLGFYRQEYWSGLLYPPPGERPNPGIEPKSPALQADIFFLTALRQGKSKKNTERDLKVSLDAYT